MIRCMNCSSSQHEIEDCQVDTKKPTVLVLVSPELIKQMGEWSDPVRVKVVETSAYPGYEMIAQSVTVTE